MGVIQQAVYATLLSLKTVHKYQRRRFIAVALIMVAHWKWKENLRVADISRIALLEGSQQLLEELFTVPKL